MWYSIRAVADDPLAQPVEHMTFNHGVRSSNLRWITKQPNTQVFGCFRNLIQFYITGVARMHFTKRAIAFLLLLACFSALCACSGDDTSENTSQGESDMSNTVYAEITMENGGVIKLELYHDIAPITVENFVSLCDRNFYDGLIFHRVISGFMIQGGDPNGNGTGGSDKNIKGEFSANGVENNLSHERGVISMARAMAPDSASSQFFICHADSVFLDGNYAAFGKVTEGMDVVDAIASVSTDYNDKPIQEQKIKTIRITGR